MNEFETDWQLVILAPNQIAGTVIGVIPDPEGCGVQERQQGPITFVKVD
jgi:hypothetical protein